jgi:hypothetical protein
VRVLEQLLRVGEDGAYLPEGCVLNINLQKAGPHSNCRAAEDYHFVLSSVFGTNHHSGIHHCNSDVLPGERSVLEFKDGCWASVTVMQAEHLIDASPAQKQFILDRAPHFFSCPGNASHLYNVLGFSSHCNQLRFLLVLKFSKMILLKQKTPPKNEAFLRRGFSL